MALGTCVDVVAYRPVRFMLESLPIFNYGVGYRATHMFSEIINYGPESDIFNFHANDD